MAPQILQPQLLLLLEFRCPQKQNKQRLRLHFFLPDMASLPAPVHPSRSQGQRVQTADVVYMFRKERKEILSGEGNLCDVVEFLAEK